MLGLSYSQFVTLVPIIEIEKEKRRKEKEKEEEEKKCFAQAPAAHLLINSYLNWD